MSITKKIFATCENETVYSYTLSNDCEFSAEILNYGGIIRRLVYKGTDVVLGRDSFSEYQNNSGYFGALIGRNSNRIENSEFTLNGKKYKLYPNNGRNNLHGGKIGFNQKIWNAELIDGDEPSLVLSAFSPDGEEGFPGNVSIKVTYTVTKDNAISIHYQGTTDADTVLNMTNHTYFNLNGHASGCTDKHMLWMNCEFYTPNSEECMPVGEIHSVKGTPFDFTCEKEVGEIFVTDFEQAKMFGGADHNFIPSGTGYRKIACLKGDVSGIAMEVYTDRPGVQFYSGNKIEEGRVCKEGAVYSAHDGLCFETQVFPNCLKYSHFPNSLLHKDEKYDTITTYKFI